MVKGLFVASCLLSIVSYYTTQRGMALFLPGWFSVVASLGIQLSMIFVAWLIGFTNTRRVLLIAVYGITGLVSVAFTYVSHYTWFSARERPALVQRKLYDVLNEAAGKAQQLLAAAVNEGQKHVMALDELTVAEKTHGHIARAGDPDPYLAKVREAVAREAHTYDSAYKEGTGEGVRYTAFDRYTKMARQSLERMRAAQQSLIDFRAQLKPLDPTEKQLGQFRKVYDMVPWPEVEESLHGARLERPAIPNYTDFLDRTASGQEEMLMAFQELFTAPNGRHAFALVLATIVDVVIFLLAYSSGPFFFGSPEQRWLSGGAAMDALDGQIFVRDFLRKVGPGPRGMARVDALTLTPGEQQLCLLFAAKGKAVILEEEGQRWYLLEPEVHQQLVESLAAHGFRLKASTPQPATSS